MDSFREKLPPNPQENANILSKLFFVWSLPFFKFGYQKVLKVNDIYEPLARDRSECLGNRFEVWVDLNFNFIDSNCFYLSIHELCNCKIFAWLAEIGINEIQTRNQMRCYMSFYAHFGKSSCYWVCLSSALRFYFDWLNQFFSANCWNIIGTQNNDFT